MKTLVFVSNFFNHHQQPLSDAFFSKLGDGYLFIETEEMSDKRKALKWGVTEYPPYVVTCKAFYGNKKRYIELIDRADVVIYGSAPNSLLRRRLRNNKLTFRYSERPLKKGFEIWKYPFRFLRWRMSYSEKQNHYLLCASAYTAEDYSKFFMFRDRCYKWGYFPKTYQYENLEYLISEKSPNSIIWVARFLYWKHPELVVELGKRLKKRGYSFQITMIGNGDEMDRIIDLVKENNLVKEVQLVGAMTPTEVRSYMEKSEIHIFTSDRNEGWGAVLNEAMNSACVPIADVNIGSAPYLIDDGNNGFLYSTIDELCEKVTYLLDHREKRVELAKAAYSTIVTEWNAENAAQRLIELAECILHGDKDTELFKDGLCSRADS